MIFAFDFHGVTLPWVEEDGDIDSEVFAKMLVDKTGRNLEDVKYYLYGIPYGDKPEVTPEYLNFVAGKLSPLHFLTYVLEELYSEHFITRENFESVELEANDLLNEYLRRTRINWEVMNILKKLVDQGHEVGYLTNRTGLSMRLLGEMMPDYINYFPLGGISSHAAFAEKPARKIYDMFYDYASDKLDKEIAPDEIVLVDDRPQNIETAYVCGWKGIVFESEEQLRNILEREFQIKF
jgi:FMN phosphatase YigB (HAD superfamily)